MVILYAAIIIFLKLLFLHFFILHIKEVIIFKEAKNAE